MAYVVNIVEKHDAQKQTLVSTSFPPLEPFQPPPRESRVSIGITNIYYIVTYLNTCYK